MKLVTLFINASLAISTIHASEITNKQIMLEAKSAVMQVGGKLKKTLGTKIKTQGLPQAALFCSHEASNLMIEASKDLPEGTTIKRVTNKPRNQNNKANKQESQILNSLKEKLKEGKMPPMFVHKIDAKHFQVYKPLVIEAKCLMCHGEQKNINTKVYKTISENYPQDKAINYKLGELRGAFIVDIVKK